MRNLAKLSAALLVAAVIIGVEGTASAGPPVDLYDFGSATNDLVDPQAFGTIAMGANGNFFGTAPNGGANGDGGVFEITPSGTESVLYDFTNADSPTCQPGLNRAGAVFVGTCYGPGADIAGALYTMTPTGAYTPLHAFPAFSGDGISPDGPPIKIGNALYGTTAYGGANNLGTIYKYGPGTAYSVLYSFTGGADGKYPAASLLKEIYGTGCTASSICLVGSAEGGGVNSCGTIFQYIPVPATFTVLHPLGCTDGSNPVAAIVQPHSGGIMYGTTDTGGANGDGVVFSLTPTGTSSAIYLVMHNFSGATDGANPQAALVEYRNHLYGTCINGGNPGGWLSQGQGTLFGISTTGTYPLNYLYLFNGSVGSNPAGGLAGKPPYLYGDTVLGGAHSAGVFYNFIP